MRARETVGFSVKPFGPQPTLDHHQPEEGGDTTNQGGEGIPTTLCQIFQKRVTLAT